MAEQVISQAELDSLFSSMEAVVAQKGEQDEAIVTLYDFRLGVKLTTGQRNYLDDQLGRLCSVLSRTLGVYMNTEVKLELQNAAPATYEQYMSNLSSPLIMVTFELTPHTPPATWQIDAPLAHTAIDCMLGATAPPGEVPNREITAVETALIGRLCQEILDTWKVAWEALSDRPLEITEVITGMIHAEEVNAPQEQNYTVTVEASFGDIQGHMNISLPASGLQPLLQEDATESREERRIQPQLLETVGRSPVPVRVTLGEHSRSIHDLLALEEGTVIDLQHYVDQLFVVSMAGRPKFLAKSGVRRGHIAVELIQPLVE